MLFVGGTGSGKSTSLAALIDHRNRNSGGHIITIEDPIEYAHRHRKSIINQREMGVDTRSFHAALKNTLRLKLYKDNSEGVATPAAAKPAVPVAPPAAWRQSRKG